MYIYIYMHSHVFVSKRKDPNNNACKPKRLHLVLGILNAAEDACASPALRRQWADIAGDILLHGASPCEESTKGQRQPCPVLRWLGRATRQDMRGDVCARLVLPISVQYEQLRFFETWESRHWMHFARVISWRQDSRRRSRSSIARPAVCLSPA